MTRLDNMSISEYLDQVGVSGWFRTLLDAAFTSEFGLEVNEQSALNLLCMLSLDTTDGFKIFGDSDERYKIAGGNQKLTDALTSQVKEQLRLQHELTIIRESDTGFELEFKNGTRKECNHLLLAVPFKVLRNVRMEVELPLEKKQVIDELGYGTSSKVLFGLKNRQWRNAGYCGYLFHDAIQNGWDNSQLQNNNQGEAGYTVFLGGKSGAEATSDSQPEYMRNLESIFKGIEFNERKSVFNWSTYPFVQGGYSCYKKGQWMTISGNEATAVGNMHFAGEHCSVDFQGYMNGGAETGRLAATAIIQAIKNSIPKPVAMQ
jgi:monoamine oxidase